MSASAEQTTIELSVAMPCLNEAETLAFRGGIEATNGRWILIGYPENLLHPILAVALIVNGLQTVFASFYLRVLGLKTATRERG